MHELTSCPEKPGTSGINGEIHPTRIRSRRQRTPGSAECGTSTLITTVVDVRGLLYTLYFLRTSTPQHKWRDKPR